MSSPSTLGSMSREGSPQNACNPLGVPAQFWYAQFAPFEFVTTSGRIFQFFENRREWRVIWMNRKHINNPPATYMGDSVGKWDGNTLVVDTVGFNGKDIIEPVGVNHLMSVEFHLSERWRLVGNKKIELEATYFDPKAWGDKPWGGLNMEFVRQRNLQLAEGYCSLEDDRNFQEKVIGPSKQAVH